MAEISFQLILLFKILLTKNATVLAQVLLIIGNNTYSSGTVVLGDHDDDSRLPTFYSRPMAIRHVQSQNAHT